MIVTYKSQDNVDDNNEYFFEINNSKIIKNEKDTIVKSKWVNVYSLA
jgi:hypothetical protein